MYNTEYENGVLQCCIHKTPISKQHGRFFCLKCQREEDQVKEYPKHCVGCWNESKCQQKFYMLANTEPVPGFVSYADIWCREHAPIDQYYESAGYYPESDNPMHCAECGRPLQCSLTDYGVAYMKEAIQGKEGCCRELWPVLFAEYLCR